MKRYTNNRQKLNKLFSGQQVYGPFAVSIFSAYKDLPYEGVLET